MSQIGIGLCLQRTRFSLVLSAIILEKCTTNVANTSAENYSSYIKLPTRVDNMALYKYFYAIGKTHMVCSIINIKAFRPIRFSEKPEQPRDS